MGETHSMFRYTTGSAVIRDLVWLGNSLTPFRSCCYQQPAAV